MLFSAAKIVIPNVLTAFPTPLENEQNKEILSARSVLGFLGGGQLARMSALQAFRFGIKTAVYATGSVPEPVEFMTPLVTKSDFNTIEDMIAFAKSCDVVTLENEFIDSGLLKKMRDESGTPMYPSPESFELIENKFIEKETFANAGIPVAPYTLVCNEADMIDFGEAHGWPYVLKSSKGGYDGYGNAFAANIEEAKAGFAKLGGDKGRDILAEAMVPFVKELAVQVVRNETGTAAYPCCETIQENHICKVVISPAPIAEDLQQKAVELAIKAIEAIDGKGIFAFEFFLTEDGTILLNESAPRPHNSGHYTIEGCVTSQFENHVRAVLGLPLGSTKMRRPAAVMINLLGTDKRDAQVDHYDKVISEPDAHLHMYGKLQSKPGRKMGHVTVLGDNTDETLARAYRLTEGMRI